MNTNIRNPPKLTVQNLSHHTPPANLQSDSKNKAHNGRKIKWTTQENEHGYKKPQTWQQTPLNALNPHASPPAMPSQTDVNIARHTLTSPSTTLFLHFPPTILTVQALMAPLALMAPSSPPWWPRYSWMNNKSRGHSRLHHVAVVGKGRKRGARQTSDGRHAHLLYLWP